MSVYLGAIKITNSENAKAFIEYKVKGRNRKKYIYFKTYSDALNFKSMIKKNIRKGVFRETFEDLKVKFLG
jgi:hypothetical protein